MAFHEKSAISMLAIMVLIYGSYFLKVFQMSAAGPMEIDAIAPLLFGMVVALVVLGAIAHIAIAAHASRSGEDPVDASDERDSLINMRGNSKSGHVLGAGVVLALFLSLTEASSFTIAHVLLGALVLSEITKLVFKIVDYRRGI